jgi:hypothetical protein
MDTIKCINCALNDAFKYSKYSNGLFCSRECARAYSTKDKRNDINQKVIEALTGRDRGGINLTKFCCNKKCNKEFIVEQRLRNQKYCSVDCKNDCDDYKRTVSKNQTKRCSHLEERIRLREIGRKGGFGTKGYTTGGVYFQSSFEKKVFEYLEENSINFEAHKPVMNSSKISDVYLPEIDLWVELDGIDREKKKKWIGKDYEYWLDKLQLYSANELNFKVFKSFDQFLNYIKIALQQ